MPPNRRNEVIRYLSTPGSDEYFEYPVTTRSGNHRIIAWHTTYLTDDEGNPTGTLSSGTDLTQMRRLREAKEMAESANRAKSQFLANMSHEIRTPMNGVLGMIELLLTSELSDKQRRHSETALRSARSLLDVLNDILDFSKIEAGKLELEEVDFELPDLVGNACHLFAERAHSKGLELHCSVSDDVPDLTAGRSDPTQPDPGQSGRQRDQVHPGGRGRCQGVRHREHSRNAQCAVRDPRHRSRSRTQRTVTASSNRSIRLMARRHEDSAAPVWAWRSRSNWSS